MKIGIIQATSQKSKNSILENAVREVIEQEHEIVNFGIFEDSEVKLTYVEVALCICLLLESKAVDFIVTGCSSGQGMMLACNSFSGVVCGYVESVSDAYLFGRINQGNAISYPLGLQWGWGAEINLKETLRAVFCEPFGNGYPVSEAERKKHDANKLKRIQAVCKRSILEALPSLDEDIVKNALSYDVVYDFIMENGNYAPLLEMIKKYR